MTQKHRMRACAGIGLFSAAAVFVALSSGGLIEFSFDMGVGRWLQESIAYAFTNKLAGKLSASLLTGFVVTYATSLVAYCRAAEKSHRSRSGRAVVLNTQPEQVGRTA